MRISITCLFLLAIAAPARADYHYASHTGSDEYPYTSWETAADSITPAMNAASPYDTIYIAAGDFQESVWADPEDTCLTFIGAGIDSTHVWENTTANMWEASDKTLVRDIFFEVYERRTMFGGWIGASITALHCKFQGPGIGVFAWGNSTIVENCEFYDFGTACFVSYPSTFIFRNNYCRTDIFGASMIMHEFSFGEITNNIFVAEDPNNEAEFYSSHATDDTVIFKNNYLDNLKLFGFEAGAGYQSEIINNTIRRTDYDRLEFGRGILIDTYRDSINVLCINNSVSDCRYGIAVNLRGFQDNYAAISYTSFWANFRGDILSDFVHVDTSNNFRAYPMFVNPDSFDVHLQANSPLIDTGDPNILDVDGTRSDIGCLGGPAGGSYIYQDLPPLIPDSISYRVWNDTIYLDWRNNYEADLANYLVHRDTTSAFTPSPLNLIAEPESSSYSDSDVVVGETYYYRLASLDNQGNRSEYSPEIVVEVTGVWQGDGAETPKMTVIESNYPNPFNSTTTIIYAVANLGPIPAQINIDIYDVLGRKVRSLVDGRKEVGRHKVIWDGKDDLGNELTSGVYFARIMQWHEVGLSKNVKLVLIR